MFWNFWPVVVLKFDVPTPSQAYSYPTFLKVMFFKSILFYFWVILYQLIFLNESCFRLKDLSDSWEFFNATTTIWTSKPKPSSTAASLAAGPSSSCSAFFAQFSDSSFLSRSFWPQSTKPCIPQDQNLDTFYRLVFQIQKWFSNNQNSNLFISSFIKYFLKRMSNEQSRLIFQFF